MTESIVSMKIVEIQEGGKHLANHYLQHGYVLIQGARAHV